MSEEWRPIPGLPGYEVSDQGRVLSRQKYHHSTEPRLLTLNSRNGWGYPIVHLRTPDGGGRVFTIHKLVMWAFIGPRPDGAVTRHLDGDPTNNALTNLRYGTASENSLDQIAHGTHPFASRTHCKNGHEYTPENTSIWTSSKGRPFRACKECHRAKLHRMRAHRAAKRAARRAAARAAT